MSHTKAPWSIELDQDEHSSIFGPEGECIGTIHRWIYDTPDALEESEANANLVFSSPDLLAALVEAACWIPDGSRRTPEQRGAKCETADEAREMIAAAITKARVGEA